MMKLMKWYSLTRQRQVLVTGPMLQEEALKIAEALGNEVFKASNGWLGFFLEYSITSTRSLRVNSFLPFFSFSLDISLNLIWSNMC